MNTDTDIADANTAAIDIAYLNILAAMPRFSNLAQADHTHTSLCHNCPL